MCSSDDAPWLYGNGYLTDIIFQAHNIATQRNVT